TGCPPCARRTRSSSSTRAASSKGATTTHWSGRAVSSPSCTGRSSGWWSPRPGAGSGSRKRCPGRGPAAGSRRRGRARGRVRTGGVLGPGPGHVVEDHVSGGVDKQGHAVVGEAEVGGGADTDAAGEGVQVGALRAGSRAMGDLPVARGPEGVELPDHLVVAE